MFLIETEHCTQQFGGCDDPKGKLVAYRIALRQAFGELNCETGQFYRLVGFLHLTGNGLNYRWGEAGANFAPVSNVN